MRGGKKNSNGGSTQKPVKQLCELFWQLEKQEMLLDFKVGNVRVWQYLRIQIYYKIAEALCVLDAPHEFKAQKNKIVRLFSFVKNSITANPFFNLTKVECIIFDHPRSKDIDGELIDIYTDYLVSEKLKSKVDFVVIERAFDLDHKRKRKFYISYLDFFILIGDIGARIFKRKLSVEEKNKIEKIEVNISEIFGISLSLSGWFEFESNKFSFIKRLFSLYLKRKSPECIYVTVSYALGYVIKAAKECGIKVVELQHGVISPYHLGYSYPEGSENLEYFPNQLWTWGTYWNDSAYFPLTQENRIVFGNHFFNSQKRKFLHTRKIKNTILFLSQGVLGERLVRFIVDVLPLLSRDYRVTLKLHPGEFDRFESYDNVTSLLAYPNVTIVKQCDLFSLFSISEYQVGVFSTAIYEGLGFGCKTILLDLPGVEYMDHLLETEIVKICDSPNSFRSILSLFSDEQTEIVKKYAKKFFN